MAEKKKIINYGDLPDISEVDYGSLPDFGKVNYDNLPSINDPLISEEEQEEKQKSTTLTSPLNDMQIQFSEEELAAGFSKSELIDKNFKELSESSGIPEDRLRNITDILDPIPDKEDYGAHYASSFARGFYTSVGEAFNMLAGAHSAVQEILGIPKKVNPFKDIAEVYLNDREKFTESPDDALGDLMFSAGAIVPDVLIAEFAMPTMAAAGLARMTKGVVKGLPKFATYLGAKEGFGTYEETGDVAESMLDGAKGFKTGLYYQALGMLGTEVGNIVTKMTTDEIAGAIADATAASMLFGVSGMAESGDWSLRTFASGAGIGVGFAIPKARRAVENAATKKMMGSYFASTTELELEATQVKGTNTELRKEAIQARIEAQQVEGVERNQLLLRAAKLENVIGIRATSEFIKQDADGMKASILADESLPREAQEYFLAKIENTIELNKAVEELKKQTEKPEAEITTAIEEAKTETVEGKEEVKVEDVTKEIETKIEEIKPVEGEDVKVEPVKEVKPEEVKPKEVKPIEEVKPEELTTQEVEELESQGRPAEKPKKEPVKLPEMEDGTRFSTEEVEKAEAKKMPDKEYQETVIKSRVKMETEGLVEGVNDYKYTSPLGDEYIVARGYDADKDAPIDSWNLYKGEKLDKNLIDGFPTRKAAEEMMSLNALSERAVKEVKVEKIVEPEGKETLADIQKDARDIIESQEAPKEVPKVTTKSEVMVTIGDRTFKDQPIKVLPNGDIVIDHFGLKTIKEGDYKLVEPSKTKEVKTEKPKPEESLLAAKTTALTTFMDTPRRRTKLDIQKDELISFLEETRDADMRESKDEVEQEKIFNDYETKIRDAKKLFSGERAITQKKALDVRRQILEDFIRDNRKQLQKLHGNVVPAIMNKLKALVNIPRRPGHKRGGEEYTIDALNRAFDYMDQVFKKQEARAEAIETTRALESVDELTNPQSKSYKDSKSGILKLKDSSSQTIREWVDKLARIRENLYGKSREEIDIEREKILDDILKREENPEVTIKEFEHLEELGMGGMWEMSTEQIVELETKLKELRKDVKTKAAREKIANKAKFEEDLTKDNLIMRGKTKVEDDWKKKVKPKSSQGLFDFVKNSSWFSLMDKFSKHEFRNSKEAIKPYDSYMVRKFGDPIHKADNEFSKGTRTTTSEIQTKYKDTFGKDIKGTGMNARRKMATIASENKGFTTYSVLKDGVIKKHNNMVTIKYETLGSTKEKPTTDTFEGSKNEIMYLWAQMQRGEHMNPTLENMDLMRRMSQHEDVREAYAKEHNLEKVPEAGEWMKTDFGEKLDKAMTPEMKEWVSYQFELYDKLYKKYNKAYKREFGYDMPHSKLYMPMYRDVETKNMSREELIMQENFVSLAHNRHLYNVTGSKAKIRRMDIDDVLFQYVHQMEHFAAKSPIVREFNKFWLNPETIKTIDQVYGSKYNDVVKNFLDDFAGKNLDGKIHAELDWLRKNFTVASLALKPVVFIKQVMSLPAYASFLPAGQLTKGVAKFLTNPEKFWKESEFFLDRADAGFDRELAALMKRSTPKKLAGGQNLASQLMFLVKAGDKVPIVLGGYAVYDYNYHKALKTNKPGTNRKYTKAEAKEIGITEFERTTRFTQQAAKVADLSYWQRGGSFAKLFTMYMTSPMSYHRLASGGLRRMVQGAKGGNWGTVAQGAKSFFIGHVLLPVVFQAAANGFSFDDEEEIKDLGQAALLGNINNLFLIGDAISTMLDSFRGKRFSYQGSPVESVVTDSKRALDEALRAFKSHASGDDLSWEEISDVMEAIITPASHVLGLPYPGLGNITEGISDVIKGETEYPLRRILGYSEKGLSRSDAGDDIEKKPKYKK